MKLMATVRVTGPEVVMGMKCYLAARRETSEVEDKDI